MELEAETRPKAVIGTNSWGSPLYERVLRGSSVDEATLVSAIEKAVELGLVYFDTAQDYGLGKCQKMIGRLCPAEVKISAKYTPVSGKYSTGQVLKSLEKDLVEFGRTLADVYWLHLPNALESNLREMVVLYQTGLVSAVGISNFNLEECKRAKDVLDAEGVPLFGVQNHYSLINRKWEKEGLLAWCKENDLSFWAWAPLEEGILAGPKKDEMRTAMKLPFERKRRALEPLFEEMRATGDAHDLTVAQVAMSFVANKGMVPIVGCRKPYQVEQLHAAANTVLSDDEMARLERVADETNVTILGADMFRVLVRR